MRDKLINKMRYAHQDCLCNADGTNEEAWEAALDALLGELEEPKVVQEIGTGFIEGKIVITDARNLYQQLLDMRKE